MIRHRLVALYAALGAFAAVLAMGIAVATAMTAADPENNIGVGLILACFLVAAALAAGAVSRWVRHR